jgi:hypothetical protein
MIFFLTDGHATAGETDNAKILSNVKKANSGGKADFDLLKILSLQHFAFARDRCHETSFRPKKLFRAQILYKFHSKQMIDIYKSIVKNNL